MCEFDKINEQITAATKKLEDLKETQRALRKERESAKIWWTREHDVAILMHEKLCRHNHTDGCGWYYRKDNDECAWTDRSYERDLYLKKARLLTKRFPFMSNKDLLDMFDIIK